MLDGVEVGASGTSVPMLTQPRSTRIVTNEGESQRTSAESGCRIFADFCGICEVRGSVRTRKNTALAPGVGFEPTTDRLTADCSTAELPRNGVHLKSARGL